MLETKRITTGQKNQGVVGHVFPTPRAHAGNIILPFHDATVHDDRIFIPERVHRCQQHIHHDA